MIQFSKMHGLGNDFIIIDGVSQDIDPSQLPVSQLADRHLGIGCDQILLIQPSAQADFFCKIFNADGSQAEQCGNGLRCVTKFIFDKKLSHKNSLTIETLGGVFAASYLDDGLVQVEMGIPVIEAVSKSLFIDHQQVQLSVLSMGNPHAVMQVSSVDNYPVSEQGLRIGSDAMFAEGVNVGFMEVVARDRIRLRTFERGVGETLACGSNACASVVAGIINGVLDSKVTVELQYGKLLIEWEGLNNSVRMIGPAEGVFEGVVG